MVKLVPFVYIYIKKIVQAYIDFIFIFQLPGIGGRTNFWCLVWCISTI